MSETTAAELEVATPLEHRQHGESHPCLATKRVISTTRLRGRNLRILMLGFGYEGCESIEARGVVECIAFVEVIENGAKVIALARGAQHTGE